jgi:hypothetical protein
MKRAGQSHPLRLLIGAGTDGLRLLPPSKWGNDELKLGSDQRRVTKVAGQGVLSLTLDRSIDLAHLEDRQSLGD